MTVLVIDNFDSFTYNLVHQVYQLGVTDVQVARNNAISLEDINALRPELIIISPGPGGPDDAGITKDVINTFMGKIPLFGVCLGMQAMAECIGLNVIQGQPMHGKSSPIQLLATASMHPLTKDLPQEFEAIRYHSLHVEENKTIHYEALASTKDDEVLMILEAHPAPCFAWGVQFHPESIGTPLGHVLMRNVMNSVENLNLCRQT